MSSDDKDVYGDRDLDEPLLEFIPEGVSDEELLASSPASVKATDAEALVHVYPDVNKIFHKNSKSAVSTQKKHMDGLMDEVSDMFMDSLKTDFMRDTIHEDDSEEMQSNKKHFNEFLDFLNEEPTEQSRAVDREVDALDSDASMEEMIDAVAAGMGETEDHVERKAQLAADLSKLHLGGLNSRRMEEAELPEGVTIEHYNKVLEAEHPEIEKKLVDLTKRHMKAVGDLASSMTGLSGTFLDYVEDGVYQRPVDMPEDSATRTFSAADIQGTCGGIYSLLLFRADEYPWANLVVCLFFVLFLSLDHHRSYASDRRAEDQMEEEFDQRQGDREIVADEGFVAAEAWLLAKEQRQC